MPGDDGPGRLAAERFSDARADSVLCRTYFPPQPRPGMPELADGPGSDRRCVGAPASGDRRAGSCDRSLARRKRSDRAVRGRFTQRDAGHRGSDARQELRRRERRLGHGAEVPAGRRRSSSCWPVASPRWRLRLCGRWPAGGSTIRSAAALPDMRSTQPGRSRTSRRCSTTTRCSRAPTYTAGR